MRVASGGGYGAPLERDPEKVRSDVVNSVVSREAARDVYGVALKPDLEIDWEATQDLKRQKNGGVKNDK
jgi:N-methylhydantoinase B